jgi:hypothetical protein
MKREAPGGAEIELLPGPTQKRSFEHHAVPVLSIAVTLGKDAGKKLFVDWLCEKVKKSKRPSMTINRRIVEMISPEAIERVIEEQMIR